MTDILRVAIDSLPGEKLTLLDFLPAAVASLIGALVAVVGTLIVQRRLLILQKEAGQESALNREAFEKRLQEALLAEQRRLHEDTLCLQTKLQAELLERQLENNLVMSRWHQEYERYRQELGGGRVRPPPSMEHVRTLIRNEEQIRQNEEKAAAIDREAHKKRHVEQ